MTQKFNKVTATSNFIKNLLASTYLPLVKTVRDTDYIIEGRLYVYKCEVIKCTKSGYIITGFKNVRDKRPRAQFEQKAEYFFGEKNDKLCTNFVSNAAGYDYLTHEKLGKYLRCLRDMYNLNLMPLYNCFSNQPLPRHHIYNDRIVSTGLNFNTKVFKVPIRFNTDYTVCMENLGMTTFAPAFVKNNNLLIADNTEFGNDTDLTNKYLKLHREGVILNKPNLRFKNPTVIRFDNIPETKEIKYYLQEDKPIDVLHTDKWYKPITTEPSDHLYVRNVDDDGIPTYDYYEYIPELSPSETLYPHDEVLSVDYEITEDKFNEDPSKYYYVSRIEGAFVYSSEEERDAVLASCEEKKLTIKYNIRKYEEVYTIGNKYGKGALLLNISVNFEDFPDDKFETVKDEIETETGKTIGAAIPNYFYVNCSKLKDFDDTLTYYYISERGLYPMSGEKISVYQGVNPSIGTFDSNIKIYTAVNLRKHCSKLTPYDPDENYYVIEGNFYVLVHRAGDIPDDKFKEEFEKNPERFYVDSDFGGDPTLYYKLVPSTYLAPSNQLFPSETLYPYDHGPSEEYTLIVSNTLGKFVRCTADEKFNINLTYAQVKYDDIGWREKEYIYNSTEISEAQFNSNKSHYYMLSSTESWKISSSAPSNSYLYERVIYPSTYRCNINAPKMITVGKEYTSAEVAFETIRVNDCGYDKVLIKFKMTEMPENSHPKVMASDGVTEYNLVETGQWGPNDGFEISKDYNVSIPLKLLFDKVGTYKASFELVDLSNDGAMICKGTKTIKATKEEVLVEESNEVHMKRETSEEESRTVYYKLVDKITEGNNYIIVDSKRHGSANALLFNGEDAPITYEVTIVGDDTDALVSLSTDEEDSLKLIALPENTLGRVELDTTYVLRKSFSGTSIEFTTEGEADTLSLKDLKLKIKDEYIYWSVPGYIQCTESDVYNAETTYYTQSYKLVTTKDTWIHLDKEYYLQHPVVSEKSYTYDITEKNCSMYEEFENNLYLLIQVPESFNSSIVILEGDYTNMESKKIYNAVDLDMIPEAKLDYFFTSKLKLMEVSTTEIIPFSDTLMEFLLWNAINGLDSLNNNMDRLAILMNNIYPEPFKDAFRKNFWFPGYREAIYKMANEYNLKYIPDNLGYFTKDVEESMYTAFYNIGKNESSIDYYVMED